MRKVAFAVILTMVMAGIGWGGGVLGVDNPPPAEPAYGDPIWHPSLEQMTGWVGAGLEAAAADMYLVDVVDGWTWSGDTPMGSGRRLEWAALLTPEFVGTVTGYEAAWHADLWERIEEGEQQAVAGELAAAVIDEWQVSTVRVLLGVTGERTSFAPQTEAWLRMWHSTSGGTAITAGRGEQRQGLPTYQWAALYYLSQAGMGGATGYEVMIHPQQALYDETREVWVPRSEDHPLIEVVRGPAEDGSLRVYAGEPGEWAMVGWAMPQ